MRLHTAIRIYSFADRPSIDATVLEVDSNWNDTSVTSEMEMHWRREKNESN